MSESTSSPTTIYRHIVGFQFKANATETEVQSIVDDFDKLAKEFDCILKFEHGLNVSTEGFDRGLTHVFLLSFRSKPEFEDYLVHPSHVAFVEKLLPTLETPPLVVDFVSKSE
ncbi:hypothetical protein MPSEU_000593000 [Mayamaea pseudoterrestris]|nr:hypothetical protein MPSEU_000593000 [Mayamaea pseudoterrestris]